MDLKNRTYDVLEKYSTKVKKRFGQNFLVDESVLNNIVKSSNISEKDLVIEIGPGIGSLTEKLIDTGAKIISFEIDRDMGEILEDRFQGISNFQLIMEDILKVDINKYIEESKVEGKVKVVANLPYYITTPIIFKLLENAQKVEEIIVMVQDEVANRITSKEKGKEYGVLTINVNYYGIPEKLFEVPRESFVPSPNVTSAVIKITRSKRYDVHNEKMFFNFIKASFSQRRKKISNSLAGANFNNLPKKEINDILIMNNVDINARAEEIPVEQYVDIVNSIEKMQD